MTNIRPCHRAYLERILVAGAGPLLDDFGLLALYGKGVNRQAAILATFPRVGLRMTNVH